MTGFRMTGLAGTLLALSMAAGAETFAPDEFLTLSGPLSPEVRMAVRKEGANYRIRVEAANPYGAVAARLGAHAGKTVLTKLDAFPSETVISPEAVGTKPLRLALEVGWLDKKGFLRQREIFLSPVFGSELAPRAALWPVFDYDAYRRRIEDERKKILIPVEQPFNGKLTVVVETHDGRRIRNLVSGVEYAKGLHRIEWDGRDEDGNLAAPGTYRFRSASHPGVSPRFRMQFANGGETIFSPFGSNHGTMTALTANARLVFAAAPLTEGGNAIIAMTPAGKLVRGYPQVGGCGIEAVSLAADDQKLYVLNDGVAWSGMRNGHAITLTVYNIDSGDILAPSGGTRQYSILHESPAPKTEPGTPKRFALGGAALFDRLLRVSNRDKNQVMSVDPASGKIVGGIPLAAPGPLAVEGGRLYAAGGRAIWKLEGDRFVKCFDLPFAPRGMTVRNGEFRVTGAPDSTVKVVSGEGRIRRSIGVPGGNYAGRWIPERLVNPVGVAFGPDGGLWVAEDRWNPKRLSRWDDAAGKLRYDKIGCPAYGSPGAGVDPENGETWIGHRCVWHVDRTSGDARVTSIMQLKDGHVQGKIPECFNYKFYRRDGRTFLFGLFHGAIISELMPDGSVRDLALISTIHQLYYAMGWKRVPAFADEVEKRFPRCNPGNQYSPDRSAGVIWVDRNGNGDFDAGEFQFFPAGTLLTENGGWGMRMIDLTARLPYRNAKGEFQILSFEPDGFNACGAPNYRAEKILAAATPVADTLPPQSRTLLEGTANDSFGRTIVNTDPVMLAIDRNGRIAWRMDNRWSNVHGSHDAPLPRTGEMQGNLFALGVAPLDREGDVMVWIGNHGRLFVLTTDGLYLDEMFSDCRVAEVFGPGLVGGEPFGGNFEFDRKHGEYLLTAGTSGYRIYTLDGLRDLKRGAGTFEVTRAMLNAASRRIESKTPAAPKLATVPRVPDVTRMNFDAMSVAAEWFPAGNGWNIQLRAAYDSTRLRLAWQVADLSPWVNRGKDWTRLFKTGDCVDFQIGTDPAAPAARGSAAPGDLRISIAPFADKPLAVRYDYAAGARPGANPVEFASPWRSCRVGDVRKLDGVGIDVMPMDWGYRVTATLPLSALGLENPAGKTFPADFGVIYGDRQGSVNLSRRYWSNQSTGLVNDVPGETMLSPNRWGKLKFGE